jgi:uncharacterized protein (TIGR00255 family)
MIYSMTGFGSGRVDVPNLMVSVEAKSVNHRYMDLHVRLPSEFQSLESVVRKAVTGSLRRGRVDLFIKIDLTREDVQMEADEKLISSYIDLTRRLQSKFSIGGELTLEAISKFPGAIKIANDGLSAEALEFVSQHVEAATSEAIGQVSQMRLTEGEALVSDLDERIGKIRKNLEMIRGGATALLQHHRESLISRAAELVPDLKLDSNRLEIEALMYAEKSDIAEEITRLGSHLDQFSGLKACPEEAGKRMDFLLQEMNREVTTILSKTSGINQSGTEIGEAGIDIKVEIDKMREQVQNIE